MGEKVKAKVMDAGKIQRSLYRMTTEIIERNRHLKNLVIVGIRTRGVFLGKRVSKLIQNVEQIKVPVGVLDITIYRDDHSGRRIPRNAQKTKLDVSVDKKDVLLVDDVLFTGRTIRAAIAALFEGGRPRTVQLLTLVDRGHRELPIRPDYAGKVLPTSRRELVRVKLKEVDGQDEVLIAESAKLK